MCLPCYKELYCSAQAVKAVTNGLDDNGSGGLVAMWVAEDKLDPGDAAKLTGLLDQLRVAAQELEDFASNGLGK